ncbi:uncharacterized protein C8Q71DRAFT_763139 [Rhodofomes roseus]|uniref:Ino eighty subunit 1 n=1 Tax=Rhodofomes roseus TaxID=34475 RepID=A0ABQ8KDI9_9APHY|nr:uncharacterized protein C8Q71DRAFT_763139 [Rhodofomes roseus]KAH9835714.1 hypothetical protein C8Q71DRAFT_763139 [Rhodofomes roseus]
MRFDRDNVRIGRCRKGMWLLPSSPASSPPPTGFMPNTAAQTTSRKTLAVKHLDGEPLTRADLQHDLLNFIFSNNQAAFTDPYRTIHGDPPRTRVSFRDLYINCLLHSPRCSKASREKILESPDFGDEFAKMSLLSNVGRINTTMAFFPEMRTALRTYHPVPSLQKTNGNLQDAPRIKNILKSCYLDTEPQGSLLSPADVQARSRSGQVPPTSVVNLIFTFSIHAGAIARTHFGPNVNLDFLDFFTPVAVSSASRARAFLWLCFHYHEHGSPNPFSDEHASPNADRIPALVLLSEEAAALENIDSPEERAWGDSMTEQRRIFMAKKAKEDDGESMDDGVEPKGRGRGAPRGRSRGKRRPRNLPESSSAAGTSSRDKDRDREASPAESFISLPPMLPEPPEGHHYSPEPYRPHPLSPWTERPPRRPSPSLPPPPMSNATPFSHARERLHSPSLPPLQHRTERLPSIPDLFSDVRDPRHFADPYPRRQSSPGPPPSNGGRPTRTRAHTHTYPEPLPPPHFGDNPYVFQPYVPPPAPPPSRPMYTYAPRHSPTYERPPQPAPRPPESQHSMLDQAWHVVMTTDPLADSDEEIADENARLDYILRLRIISRLRGKEPTPEPESIPQIVPFPIIHTHTHANAHSASI